MTYSGGRLAFSVGVTAWSHASACLRASMTSPTCPGRRIGMMASSDVSRSSHSRKNRSPRFLPSTLTSAMAPVLIATSSAEVGGRSSGASDAVAISVRTILIPAYVPGSSKHDRCGPAKEHVRRSEAEHGFFPRRRAFTFDQVRASVAPLSGEPRYFRNPTLNVFSRQMGEGV